MSANFSEQESGGAGGILTGGRTACAYLLRFKKASGFSAMLRIAVTAVLLSVVPFLTGVLALSLRHSHSGVARECLEGWRSGRDSNPR